MTTTKESTMAITMRRQPGPVMKRMGQQQALIGERAILDGELITGTLTMDKDCVATIVTEERFKAQLEGWGYEDVR